MKTKAPKQPTSHAGRGRVWEKLLELEHSRIERQNRGVVFRTPPNVQLLGKLRGGAFRAVPTAVGPPDYMLLLRTAGQPVAVILEAKDCAGERWALKQLHDHQADSLARWSAVGGLGVVALRHKKSETYWLLPWHRLAPIWNRWKTQRATGSSISRGTASLSLVDLYSIGFQWKLGVDYFDKLIEAHKEAKSEI